MIYYFLRKIKNVHTYVPSVGAVKHQCVFFAPNSFHEYGAINPAYPSESIRVAPIGIMAHILSKMSP